MLEKGKRNREKLSKEAIHIPVLVEEAINFLDISANGIYVDATVGCGGHAEAILEKLDEGILIGIDRDPEALKCAKDKLTAVKGEYKLVHGNFAHLGNILTDLQISQVDGVLFDLGLSSLQLESSDRGFSFQKDSPLDMRMDSASSAPTAADVVNGYPRGELIRVIGEYGEERWAKRIASKIVESRSDETIQTTGQLVEIIKDAIPDKYQYQLKIHPATKTFQALRIEVNGELENLKRGLEAAYSILKIRGRLVAISYHSLEDRIVKNFFKEKSKDCICPPQLPECVCDKEKQMSIITSSPVTPSQKEIEDNPRSRSAKLRAASKIR